jgi:hypothetical protein
MSAPVLVRVMPEVFLEFATSLRTKCGHSPSNWSKPFDAAELDVDATTQAYVLVARVMLWVLSDQLREGGTDALQVLICALPRCPGRDGVEVSPLPKWFAAGWCALGCSAEPERRGNRDVAVTASSKSSESKPEVRTTAGVLRGGREAGLAVFRGIPFAGAPVGAFRFAAPEPVRGWDGVRLAVAYGPPPPQSGVLGG